MYITKGEWESQQPRTAKVLAAIQVPQQLYNPSRVVGHVERETLFARHRKLGDQGKNGQARWITLESRKGSHKISWTFPLHMLRNGSHDHTRRSLDFGSDNKLHDMSFGLLEGATHSGNQHRYQTVSGSPRGSC